MNLPRYARVLLAIGSGAALGLAFPNYNFYLLAWVAMGLLVLASAGAPLKEAPLYGFLHGQVFYPVCLPWVDTVMRQYGNIDPWIAAAFVGFIGFVGGLICTMFSTGVALASRRSKLLACAIAPFLWTALEYFRTNIPIIGSSWDLSGYPAAHSLALLQITSVTGIYGLCFLIAAYGSLVAYAVLERSRRGWMIAAGVTLLLVVVAAGGTYLIPAATPHYVAHLVQTNFPQSESYPADWLTVHAGELDQLEKISVDAAKRGAWNHHLAGGSRAILACRNRYLPSARRGSRARPTIIFWWASWTGNERGGKWLAFNSAVLLNPAGQRIYSYDKIHLLPFGEYVPLRGWLTFAKRLTADISDFTPGSTYSVAADSAGKIWRVHLLRGDFSFGGAAIYGQWRAVADYDFE